jgi:hypothetical protein
MEPQGQAQQGGGIVEALIETDKRLFSIVNAVSQSPAPDEVKQAFGQALEAYRAGLEALTGGGQQPEQQGAVAPEAGGNPNAQPMGMGGR